MSSPSEVEEMMYVLLHEVIDDLFEKERKEEQRPEIVDPDEASVDPDVLSSLQEAPNNADRGTGGGGGGGGAMVFAVPPSSPPLPPAAKRKRLGVSSRANDQIVVLR